MAKRRPPPGSDLSRILDEAMKSHPELKTQAALARKAGVAQSTISRMKRGEVDPQSSNVQRVLEALGIAKHQRTVPLISLVQAGDFGETVDPYEPGDGKDWLVCPVPCGPKTIALKVDGESMEPRYHNGDIIYVDPDVSPVHGSDVVVRLEKSNEATFKQLVLEGRRRYLKPLNPRFPIIEITAEARFVGVVVGATWAKSQPPRSSDL